MPDDPLAPGIVIPLTPRPLSADNLRTHVSSYLAGKVPEDHSSAVVTVVNLEHVEVVAALKVNDNWTVDLIGQYAWNGDKTFEVMSTISW